MTFLDELKMSISVCNQALTFTNTDYDNGVYKVTFDLIMQNIKNAQNGKMAFGYNEQFGTITVGCIYALVNVAQQVLNSKKENSETKNQILNSILFEIDRLI